MSSEYKFYEYKRGNDFSCMVRVDSRGEDFMFRNIIYPETATQKQIDMFLEEAEIASIKQLESKHD